MAKIVLIDGHSILNRAFYGVPLLSNSEGLHTNAVYGFLNIMFKVLDEEHADALAVAFDVHAPTFRHDMYADYKGTRKPMQEELREQVPVMKQVLQAMQIVTLERAGYEADDILGTLAARCEALGYDVSVISGDRDLLQLATDRVRIRIPKTRKTGTEVEDYYAADVMAAYQVTPREFIDMKALMGDASDNIPGVPGIGEKTAGKIIQTYHTIEEAYAHVDELKPKKAAENLKTYYDQALFCRQLVTIKTDCEIEFDPEKAGTEHMFNAESYQLLKRLELKQILKRFDDASALAGVETRELEILKNASDCEAFVRNFPEGEALGMRYFHEGDFEGFAAAGREIGPVFMMASAALSAEKIRELAMALIAKAGRTYADDLKPQLSDLPLTRADPVTDVAIQAYLVNPLKDNYQCDSLALEHLGQTLPSRTDYLKKLSLSQAVDQAGKELRDYIAQEAVTPLQVGPVLEARLKELEMTRLFEEIEMPLVYVLHDMEAAGICVEKEALAEYGRQLTGRISELEHNIYALAGEEFNIQSPKQLGVVLFAHMHLPFGKKTKTGYSTSADVLEKLREHDPIIGQILEYRQLTKLKSTYADGLAAYISPEDQRIHGTFNQTITATGRISSTEPNLQNIPVRMELGRMIRKVFVPGEGCVFINADYSQIELRVLAHMAGDAHLIEAYRQHADIHRITASQVFHVPFDEVTPLQRRNAKAVNFGIVYGISSFGLSQDLSISRKEADGYIKKYFETYPGIKSFLDKAVADAKTRGYAETLYGRRRPVPELSSGNFMQRSFGERVAMNSPIQGTAADIIKIAMIRVADRLKREGLKSRLILQIHDELLIETAVDEQEAVKKILKEEMMGAASLAVPLEIDMNSGNNWYDLK